MDKPVVEHLDEEATASEASLENYKSHAKNDAELGDINADSDFDLTRQQRDQQVRTELGTASRSAQQAIATFAQKQHDAASGVSFKAVAATAVRLPKGFGERALKRAMKRVALQSSLLEKAEVKASSSAAAKVSDPYSAIVAMRDEDAAALLSAHGRSHLEQDAEPAQPGSQLQAHDRLIAERDAAEQSYRNYLASKRRRERGLRGR